MKKSLSIIIPPTIVKLYNYMYYYYLRQKIYKSNNITDLISVFKTISHTNTNTSADDILNILIECFTRYPLSECELQKLSIWQQEYENTHNIHNYVSTVCWIAAIYYINK